MNALTLNAHYGTASGEVILNGVPLTEKLFKEKCFVVKQHDIHWPFLTCRETLRFAAGLYNRDNVDTLVENTIDKMGLKGVADNRNSSLSGGQRRRLSLGIGMLKQPVAVSKISKLCHISH